MYAFPGCPRPLYTHPTWMHFHDSPWDSPHLILFADTPPLSGPGAAPPTAPPMLILYSPACPGSPQPCDRPGCPGSLLTPQVEVLGDGENSLLVPREPDEHAKFPQYRVLADLSWHRPQEPAGTQSEEQSKDMGTWYPLTLRLLAQRAA